MKKTVKKIYSKLPLKKELFSFLKIFPIPKKIYQHLHFKAEFKVTVSKNKNFKIKHYGYELENDLFWKGINGGWEKESTKLWIKLCAISDVIFDIGANTGIYALLAKTINIDSKVFAFEPVERVFKKLQNNSKINNFDIHCNQLAVSNKNGVAVIYDSNSEHVYSVTVNKNMRGNNPSVFEVRINTITLSTFIQEQQLKKIDLMKIDVETHESEVLEGMGDFLNKFKPTLLIEILTDEVAEKIEFLLKDIEYIFFNIDENKGVKKVEKLTHSDSFNYLICSMEVAQLLQLI